MRVCVPSSASLWNNKAALSITVVFILGVLALVLLPSDASRIATALLTRRHIVLQPVRYFVERHVVSDIVNAIVQGENFVIVEGGNGMGKSIAVKAAAANLSRSRTVLWYNSTPESTLLGTLHDLYGLERMWLIDRLISVVLSKVLPVTDVQKLVLSRNPTLPEPVLVVEKAEHLSVHVLKGLVNFAKELVDAKLGPFVFVFSPSDKLNEIAGYGAMSRAEVIPVQDFSLPETMQYLSYCVSPERASMVHTLIGGHLPHLMEKAVPQFCSDAMDFEALTSYYSGLVAAKLKSVDMQLGCRAGHCSCNATCAVLLAEYDNPLFMRARDVLLKKHLIRASLSQEVYVIDAPFIRTYIQKICKCTAVPSIPHAPSQNTLLGGLF